ncbi:unnamed protein product [Lampetra planeri]
MPARFICSDDVCWMSRAQLMLLASNVECILSAGLEWSARLMRQRTERATLASGIARRGANAGPWHRGIAPRRACDSCC